MKRSGPAVLDSRRCVRRPPVIGQAFVACGAGTVNTLTQAMEAQLRNNRSFLRWVEGRDSAPSCVIDRK